MPDLDTSYALYNLHNLLDCVWRNFGANCHLSQQQEAIAATFLAQTKSHARLSPRYVLHISNAFPRQYCHVYPPLHSTLGPDSAGLSNPVRKCHHYGYHICT